MISRFFNMLSQTTREMMNRLMGGRTEPEPLTNTSGGIYRTPAYPQTNQKNEMDDFHDELSCEVIQCFKDDPPYSIN